MMKIALIQYYPKLKKVQENINKVNAMLSNKNYKPGELTVLVLPEMSFTGYCFCSKSDIEPFVEELGSDGVSIEWAKSTAKFYSCFVCVGFPLKEKSEYFNAVAFVDNTGQIIKVYKKHFLYETDYNWASEGSSFESFEVDGLGKIGLGICMDLNPYNFTAPFDAFEFANFHLSKQTRLIFCSMNWLTHDRKPFVSDINCPSDVNASLAENQLDYINGNVESSCISENLSYWFTRLSPVIGKKVIVVICNRVGREGETVYVGSSCVFNMEKPPYLLGNLNRIQESVMEIDIKM